MMKTNLLKSLKWMRWVLLPAIVAVSLLAVTPAYAQEPEDDPVIDDDEDALDDDGDDDDDSDDDEDDEDDNEEQSDGEEEMTSEEREENGDGLKRAHDDDNDLGGCGY